MVNPDAYDTQPRRQDRTVADPAWIEAFLQHAAYGVLSMAPGGRPYAHPILFAYDSAQRAVFLHSADEGRTIDSVQENPEACFTAGELGRFLPAKRSRGFSVEYSSVVAFGKLFVVEETAERLHGLRLLMAKYAPHLQPGQDYAVLTEDELAGVAVYRLDIHAWSGKRHPPEPDAPGAYRFPPETLTGD